MWDWDALFSGIGALPFGGGRYLLGSFLNFLDHATSEGHVPGCLTPKGPSSTLAHAKPVVIQGALLGARAVGAVQELRAHQPKMRALLSFWDRERLDPASGLYVWHDQMESGADDLPYAEVPSKHTPEWREELHARTLSSPDLAVFLHREHAAYASCLGAWAEAEPQGEARAALEAEAAQHTAKAADVAQRAAARLWHDAGGGRGWWAGFNTRTQTLIPTRTYQMAWPLWVPGMGSPEQRACALAAVLEPDMRAPAGIRSTSSLDARFELADAIIPYSIWRGPVWLNVNMVLCYSLMACGAGAEARRLGSDLVRVLALDLRTSGAWHECYHPDTGAPLSKESKGFLSWTVMAADLLANVEAGVDPTRI